MRDFYDVYLIYTKDWNCVNLDHFKEAIEVTFNKRGYSGNPMLTLNLIMDSSVLKERWKSYQKKYNYASNIEFEEIIVCLKKIINEVM